jgi:hypothetical protein
MCNKGKRWRSKFLQFTQTWSGLYAALKSVMWLWFCKRKIGILTIDAKFSNELIQYLVQYKILSNSLLMKAKINVNRYDDQRQKSPPFVHHQDPPNIPMTSYHQQHSQHHLIYSNNPLHQPHSTTK